MQIANAEISTNDLIELQRLGVTVTVNEGDAEVWINVWPGLVHEANFLRVIEIIAGFRADEVGMVDGRLRLWWD